MAARTYIDFASVAAQDPLELRRLLHEGDPAERAWAGWALAIRIGREANPELEDAARSSPTPGVRSLLLVILAGHGERELIEAFAVHDPDEDVRASACRYLAGITSTNDKAAVAFLIERLGSDESSEVRAEILGLVNDGRLESPRPLVESHVGDIDLRVRTLAADVLLRDSAAVEGLPSALRTRAIHEPDDQLRGTLGDAWIARGGATQLLDAVTSDDFVDQARSHELLDRLAGAGVRSDWLALRSLTERDAVTDDLVGRLLTVPSPPEALSWLLDIAARPLGPMPPVVDRETSQRAGAIHAAAYTAWQRLTEILPNTDWGSLTSSDRRQVARLTDSLGTQLDDERAMALEDEGLDLDALPASDQPDWYRQNVALLLVMRRLVAAGGA